jgi:hypothetical protein
MEEARNTYRGNLLKNIHLEDLEVINVDLKETGFEDGMWM